MSEGAGGGASIPPARIGEIRPPLDESRLGRSMRAGIVIGVCAYGVGVAPLLGVPVSLAFGGYYGWRWRRQARAQAGARAWAEIRAALERGELARADVLIARREHDAVEDHERALLARVRGEVEWRSGDLDAALVALTRYATLVPTAPPGQETFHARALVDLANLELELDRREDAAATIERVGAWPARELEVARVGLLAHQAFALDRPELLGDATARAAHVALARAKQEGLVLAALAWACERAGDAATAAALDLEAAALVEAKATAAAFAARYPRSWPRLEARMRAARAGAAAADGDGAAAP